jgi:hypothetical protein
MHCYEEDHITHKTGILKLIYFTYLHFTMSYRIIFWRTLTGKII